MATFNPPVDLFQYPTGNRLMDRLRPKRGYTVYSTDNGATWRQSVFPYQGDLIGDEGTYWFLGGHTYTVTADQATSLTDAGYGAYIT